MEVVNRNEDWSRVPYPFWCGGCGRIIGMFEYHDHQDSEWVSQR